MSLCLSGVALLARFLPLVLLLLSACQPVKQREPVTVVVGSWYGFYPLYYALEQGLDADFGLRLKILEPTDISDLRRSYLRTQVDFAATSMLEFSNATSFTQQWLKPVIITDYSNGGDVVVATQDIKDIQQLKEKRVAVPSNGIGEYIMSLAFDHPDPESLFEQHKLRESDCLAAFIAQKIDACVTYPPISTRLLEEPNLHSVYSTKQHPGRVFDLLWAKPTVSQATAIKMQNMWFSIIKKIEQNPVAYHQFVAAIAGVSESSVRRAMQGIQLVGRQQHQTLLENKDLLANDLVAACDIASGKHCNILIDAFDWE